MYIIEYKFVQVKKMRGEKMKIKVDVKNRLGNFAPRYAQYSEEVLFGDLWDNEDLSLRDRSLITISSIISLGNFSQLPFHLKLGLKNGLEQKEIIEAITHICFYSGWPKGDMALTIAKEIFQEN